MASPTFAGDLSNRGMALDAVPLIGTEILPGHFEVSDQSDSLVHAKDQTTGSVQLARVTANNRLFTIHLQYQNPVQQQICHTLFDRGTGISLVAFMGELGGGRLYMSNNCFFMKLPDRGTEEITGYISWELFAPNVSEKFIPTAAISSIPVLGSIL